MDAGRETPDAGAVRLLSRLGRAGAVAVGVAVPVGALAWLVRAESSALADLDERTVARATALTRDEPALHRALLVWDEAFQARWLNLAGAVLCVWLWRRHPRLRRRVVWGLSTVLVAWGLANLLKVLVRRARPAVEGTLADAPGWSFPSGHAMNTTTAAVALTVVVWPLLGRRARVAVPVVAGSAVVLTCVDRVMLGVHHPSDVAAGVLLGVGAAWGSYLGWSGSDVLRTGQDSAGRGSDASDARSRSEETGLNPRPEGPGPCDDDSRERP